MHRFATSEATSWIRPYFSRNEKHNLLRPCGPSASCHEISVTLSSLPSTVIELPENRSSNELDTSSSHIIAESPSYMISVTLPNGDYAYLPLPQKRALNYN